MKRIDGIQNVSHRNIVGRKCADLSWNPQCRASSRSEMGGGGGEITVLRSFECYSHRNTLENSLKIILFVHPASSIAENVM